ncbi:MAG TPA: hypothetical protein VFE78_30335, partial [Gemmataceae bacterium]|nr:hypothetical protein [Gemmataceae bacterium]
MFDMYHKWLGIPEDQRPPTYYQLLGVAPSEADPEVIEELALRQTSHVRTYQTGPHAVECARLLNEIAHARTVLLNPARRRPYDAHLRAARADRRPPVPAGAVAPAPVALAGGAAGAAFEGLDEPTPHRRRRRRRGGPVAAVTGALLLAVTTVGLAVWGGAAPGTAPGTSPAKVSDNRPAPRATPAGEVRRFHGRVPPVHAVAFAP